MLSILARAPSCLVTPSRSFSTSLSRSHGVKTLGVVGVGQLGLGIAYVASKVAKVNVLMADRDEAVVQAGFAFIDRLLAKDVKKGKMTEGEAKETRSRISSVGSIEGFAQVDIVVEVRPPVLNRNGENGSLIDNLEYRRYLNPSHSSRRYLLP